jgi:exodeoxyribonuclease VII large subunit
VAELGDTTWSVCELHDALNEVIEVSFGSSIWVTGELRSLNRSPAGHAYFDLVDPETNDRDPARLSVTLFNGYRQRVNAVLKKAHSGISMEEGTLLRVQGELRSYPVRSRLQLVMTGIDPTYTIGVMAQHRDRVLAALAADGLLERNSQVALVSPPLQLALVTSRGSAAEADVLEEIRRSGFGFEVALLDARTQGREAEATLVAALRTAASIGCDAVLLVRGGGSRSDLAPFDSELLGRTIAELGVPVLTGIGHETDTSVADEVAHSSFKTPTACAVAVVSMVRRTSEDLNGIRAAVASAARGRLDRASSAVSTRAHTTALAGRGHLSREERLVLERSTRLGRAVALSLQRRAGALDHAASGIRPAVESTLAHRAGRVEQCGALVSAHDPKTALARGWTITRDAEGALVRSVDDVQLGTDLLTQTGDGLLRSTVTAKPTTRRPDDPTT